MDVVATPVRSRADVNETAADDKINYGLLDSFIGFHLRLANDRVYENFVNSLGDDRLRPRCFTMLTLIANNPGITQIAISRAAGLDKSTVAKGLRYMEDRGLIRRVRLDDDRRSYASYVTKAGSELSQHLAERAHSQSAYLISLIGAENKKALLKILKKLIDTLP
ncbi:MarR family transcriptional regulator [Pseudochelatococcus sp. B33]